VAQKFLEAEAKCTEAHSFNSIRDQ
jgi:hypothetical protein